MTQLTALSNATAVRPVNTPTSAASSNKATGVLSRRIRYCNNRSRRGRKRPGRFETKARMPDLKISVLNSTNNAN